MVAVSSPSTASSDEHPHQDLRLIGRASFQNLLGHPTVGSCLTLDREIFPRMGATTAEKALHPRIGAETLTNRDCTMLLLPDQVGWADPIEASQFLS